MATFYWNWTWPSGDKRAYKQWFDFECSTPNLRRIVMAEKDPDNCIACGAFIDDQEPYTILWVTYILPGNDKASTSFAYHVSCFESEAEIYSANAKRLEVRSDGAGGAPRPVPGNKWDSWQAMGIKPA
jgi:hypothetical protein